MYIVDFVIQRQLLEKFGIDIGRPVPPIGPPENKTPGGEPQEEYNYTMIKVIIFVGLIIFGIHFVFVSKPFSLYGFIPFIILFFWILSWVMKEE